MVITVQCIERRWRLVHPSLPDAPCYARGADAFDAAARLAREHHQRTGRVAAVRVQAYDASVEAARFG